MEHNNTYKRGFFPYALATGLIGLVGGFSTVLGPAFVQDLQLDYNNTTWTALAQAISTAACAPILGRMGDVLGRKRTLLGGIAVFTLGNVLSALADSLPFMLVARFIVGIGTAAMAPVIMSYIVTEFPLDKTASGFSLYMLISSASVVLGPTLGGLLTGSFGWRVMLWVCTGIGLTVLVLCLLTPREAQTRSGNLSDFDSLGAVLTLIFFSLLLCLPAFGQSFGWSSLSFVLLLIGALISLPILILVEASASHPLLSGTFIRRKAFWLSVLALFLTQGLMQADMTGIIIFVNYTQPENTLISSYAISLMYLGMSLGAILLGPLADRRTPKMVLGASLLLTGVGCTLPFFFHNNTPPLLLMAFLGILGFGLGGNSSIFMKVVLSGLSAKEAGAGTGTYGLFRDLASPFGVAVLVPLFTNQLSTQLAGGIEPSQAAVHAIHSLATVQLFCIAFAIIAICFLPAPQNRKDESHGIKG